MSSQASILSHTNPDAQETNIGYLVRMLSKKDCKIKALEEKVVARRNHATSPEALRDEVTDGDRARLISRITRLLDEKDHKIAALKQELSGSTSFLTAGSSSSSSFDTSCYRRASRSAGRDCSPSLAERQSQGSLASTVAHTVPARSPSPITWRSSDRARLPVSPFLGDWFLDDSVIANASSNFDRSMQATGSGMDANCFHSSCCSMDQCSAKASSSSGLTLAARHNSLAADDYHCSDFSSDNSRCEWFRSMADDDGSRSGFSMDNSTISSVTLGHSYVIETPTEQKLSTSLRSCRPLEKLPLLRLGNACAVPECRYGCCGEKTLLKNSSRISLTSRTTESPSGIAPTTVANSPYSQDLSIEDRNMASPLVTSTRERSPVPTTYSQDLLARSRSMQSGDVSSDLSFVRSPDSASARPRCCEYRKASRAGTSSPSPPPIIASTPRLKHEVVPANTNICTASQTLPVRTRAHSALNAQVSLSSAAPPGTTMATQSLLEGDVVRVLETFPGDSDSKHKRELHAGMTGVLRTLDGDGDGYFDFYEKGIRGVQFTQWVLKRNFSKLNKVTIRARITSPRRTSAASVAVLPAGSSVASVTAAPAKLSSRSTRAPQRSTSPGPCQSSRPSYSPLLRRSFSPPQGIVRTAVATAVSQRPWIDRKSDQTTPRVLRSCSLDAFVLGHIPPANEGYASTLPVLRRCQRPRAPSRPHASQ